MVGTNFNFFGITLLIFLVLVCLAACYSFYITYKVTTKYWHTKKPTNPVNRHAGNPILSPREYHEWEAIGTFNPAAHLDDAGTVHLLYRAVGADGVSRIGYAVSNDGTNFERFPYAVFSVQSPRAHEHALGMKKFDPVQYPSGGSWGGCEDPRITRIDGKLYLTFNAFDGWDFIRIGVSSISEEDFLNRRWKWSKPLLISPPGEVHKNWVLFPEKINGKFAILHSISPHIQIDYVDTLEQLAYGSVKIKSHHGQKKREGWDSRVRGAGPPPIKTPHGWLVLYHAISHDEPNKYKLGAMMLDLADPSKIIARCSEPLLCPEHWYENDWKPGVVYATGAVVKNDTLSIYYGAGDKHVGTASTPMAHLFKWLHVTS